MSDRYKGQFAGIAPIWVMDPFGSGLIHPRGVAGHLLLPFAQIVVQAINMLRSSFDPAYISQSPISFDERRVYNQPDRPKA